MIKLNRILLVLLAILVLVASVGMVASDDSGSGSIAPDDGSPTDDYTYDDDSNVGSLDSDDEEDDDPLDEEYYGMGSGSGDDGDSFTADLSKHATANPVLILVLSLLSVWFGVEALNSHPIFSFEIFFIILILAWIILSIDLKYGHDF